MLKKEGKMLCKEANEGQNMRIILFLTLYPHLSKWKEGELLQIDFTKIVYMWQTETRQVQGPKHKLNLSKRIGNNKVLDITCLLGSKRIVNVCTRKGSKTGWSGSTGRNDENGTLTCRSNKDRKHESYDLIYHQC